jgi:N-methylhydantoinase A
VCFDDAGWIDSAVYWRPDLAAGQVVDGPAVIEDFGATVPLPAGFQADVDPLGNLLVTRGRA